MPTDATVVLLPKHQELLLTITSARTRRRLAQRLISLKTFPQQGTLDDLSPQKSARFEYRVTYVPPYAIRYTYDRDRNEVRVDSITNERANTFTRFL